MGLHDAEEMLEAAKEDAAQLEREVAKLRAVLARATDLVGEEISDLAERFDYPASAARTKLEGILHVLDGAAATESDLSPLSGVMVNGKRLTWREVAADREERLRALEPAVTLLADLSRNRNGRHEGDVDAGEISLGNPHLRPGQTIGYSIHGTHAYVVPERGQMHDPAAWKQPRR